MLLESAKHILLNIRISVNIEISSVLTRSVEMAKTHSFVTAGGDGAFHWPSGFTKPLV